MNKNLAKNIFRIVLLLGTAISLYFVPWIVVKAWIMPLPDTVQEQMDDAITYGFDGMVVYVDQAGKPPQFYAAGYKNTEKKIPADPHALFKIASISKLYDAVSIAKLVHDGQLSLDKTLADYFPELENRIENAQTITLKNLVQHRSGIPNFTDTYNYWVDPPEGQQENLNLILDKPANFQPGDDYEYCNTNYLLLTMLIEKVTGEDKFEFIKKRILEPLHLKNTYGSLEGVDLDEVMSGYYVGVDEDLKTNDTGMLATAEDVGIFLRALNDGSVFEGDEQDIYSSIYVYNHTGLVPGYQSIAKYHPEADMVVVQFTNTVNFQGYNWNLSEVFYSRIVKILEKH